MDFCFSLSLLALFPTGQKEQFLPRETASTHTQKQEHAHIGHVGIERNSHHTAWDTNT